MKTEESHARGRPRVAQKRYRRRYAAIARVRTRYLRLLVVLVIPGCGIVAASHAAAWTAPVDVSSSGNVSLVGVGIAPGGNAIVGWKQTVSPSNLEARIRRPDGSLSATKQIAGDPDFGVLNPQMQMNPTGSKAVFVWRAFNGSNYHVQLRTLLTNGVLGPVITVTPPNGDVNGSPAFGVDGSDNVVLAWDDSHRIDVRTIGATGTLGPITTVSPPSENAQDPSVAVNTTGDAVIGWERTAPDVTYWAVQRQSDGSVGSPTLIALIRDATEQIGIASSGDATFFRAGGTRCIARRLTADGILGSRLLVSLHSCLGTTPDMATNGVGTSLFAWDGNGLRVRSLSPAGVFDRVGVVTGPAPTADPDVSLNSEGDSVIGWKQLGKFPGDADVVRRSSGGIVGSIHVLGTEDSDPPLVALNTGGEAVAAWTSPLSTPRVRVSVDP